MKTPLDPRHQRRRRIIQELFAWQLAPTNKLSDEKSTDIVRNIAALNKLITEAAPDWEIDKINRIDLAILRLAVYELVFEHSEPPKAIIDEAVELAHEFGNESSPSFINGALGKVLIAQSRIRKIIADKLGVEIEKLHRQAKLREDLNADDLEIADLIASLEKELAVTAEPTSKFITVGDILDFVEDQSE